MADMVELYAGFASPIQVHFAALNDLDSVPTGAGWYAWFQIPGSLSPESFQLYRLSTVDSSVTGIFNLTFGGRLKTADAESPPSFEPAGDDESLETLKSLFLAFAPPLYIGISKNLRARLKTHRKRLQEFFSTADGAAQSTAKGGIKSDSERESQYFGARIGLALRTLKLSPDTLHVKCVPANDPAQLKKIERALNFALTPHYGRK